MTSENWANENVRFWGQNSITNMKKKRHSTEQVIQILRKADGEKTVEELCRESNISEQTFYRWRRGESNPYPDDLFPNKYACFQMF